MPRLRKLWISRERYCGIDGIELCQPLTRGDRLTVVLSEEASKVCQGLERRGLQRDIARRPPAVCRFLIQRHRLSKPLHALELFTLRRALEYLEPVRAGTVIGSRRPQSLDTQHVLCLPSVPRASVPERARKADR